MVCASLVVLAALAGCSDSGAQTSADCEAQVRVGDVVYTAIGTTERRAAPHASAERADCKDVGEDAAGSVFSEDPDEVATWAFDGHSPDKVLGVRYGKDSFGVFVADSVSADGIERIFTDLLDN